MQQPEGFPQGSPHQVLRLLKSIYGLKQSPRLWAKKLNSVLLSLGFSKIKLDSSVSGCMRGKECLLLCLFLSMT